MKEEVLPFFINDLKSSLIVKVHSTPLSISLNEPSIIICSESSILQYKESHYQIVADKTDQKYTPDINKLFHSFAQYSSDFDLKILIMTGIGNDGVDGAIKLKALGATVIAEDESSCAVFGMPRVALESGIVDEVKTLEELIKYFKEPQWVY